MTNPNFLNNYWVPLPHTRAPAHTYFQFLLLLTPANTSRKKLKSQYSCGRDFRLSAYKNYVTMDTLMAVTASSSWPRTDLTAFPVSRSHSSTLPPSIKLHNNFCLPLFIKHTRPFTRIHTIDWEVLFLFEINGVSPFLWQTNIFFSDRRIYLSLCDSRLKQINRPNMLTNISWSLKQQFKCLYRKKAC